jgi:hypothetical protein
MKISDPCARSLVYSFLVYLFRSPLFLVSLCFCWVSYLSYANFLGKKGFYAVVVVVVVVVVEGNKDNLYSQTQY